MGSGLLIYGSYGYSGDLIARRAAEEGLEPVLAGRDADKLGKQAKDLNLSCRPFSLDNVKSLAENLKEAKVVLHCAGPFSHTAQQMARACMDASCHYLDITGEIEVFEKMALLDAEAKQARVMLMPGVGFDVVPSDCLAAHVKRRLPSATQLTLAFKAIGRPSRGTATTMVENIPKGGMIRKDGKLTPSAWKKRKIDFGQGEVEAMSIPWGDVSTAYHSTRIPNIEVYMAATPDLMRMASIARYFGWLLGLPPVLALLKMQIRSGPAGPSEEDRRTGQSLLWGEVRNNGGESAAARMRTAEGYTLTAQTAVEIAKRALGGNAPAGFQTPSMAYGPDFILEIEGVERTDL